LRANDGRAAMAFLLAAGVLSLVSTPASSQERAAPRVDLALGVATRIFIAENDEIVSESGYIVSWSFSAAVRPKASWRHIWLELGYSYGVTSAPLHQVGTAALDLSVFELAVLYRAPIIRNLNWLASIGPTIALGNLSLSDSSGNNLGSQLSAEPGVQAEVGLEATFNDPEKAKFVWGARLDVGFGWQANFNFNAVKAPAQPMMGYNPSQAPANIGSISSSGAVGRLAIFLRF
jgi:hypothetical protein